jgi:hypothetical protein
MKKCGMLVNSLFVVSVLCFSVNSANALPTFYSTDTPSAWTVAVNIGGVDGQFSSFPTTGFNPAVAVLPTIRPDNYIANNDHGTNGPYPGSTWVFFDFRQTFDLTGYNPATADLKFQWAADDSGEVWAARGAWTPKFSLNGGSLIEYPGSPTATYGYSPMVDLSGGFVSGLNTIDFYVEGNSVTDGFALRTESFTAVSAQSVPEPATMLLLGLGLAGVAGMRKKNRN